MGVGKSQRKILGFFAVLHSNAAKSVLVKLEKNRKSLVKLHKKYALNIYYLPNSTKTG